MEIWNGDADLANVTFGERYGTDWEYIGNTQDIMVNNSVISVGQSFIKES